MSLVVLPPVASTADVLCAKLSDATIAVTAIIRLCIRLNELALINHLFLAAAHHY
jgi:hypothetical protein